jgi:hypothetical protein
VDGLERFYREIVMIRTTEAYLKIFERIRGLSKRPHLLEDTRAELQEWVLKGNIDPEALELWDRWVKECYKGGKPYTVLILQEQETTLKQGELF